MNKYLLKLGLLGYSVEILSIKVDRNNDYTIVLFNFVNEN